MLREARRWAGDPVRLLRTLEAGESVKVPLLSEFTLFVHATEAARQATGDKAVPNPDPEALRQLLLFCSRRRTALAEARGAERYANALVALAARRGVWVRPLDDWRPVTHNADRQFRSLLRHLVVTYDVPAFLDAAWFEGLTPEGVRHQDWFLHVASGRNLRTAMGLPVPLTRRQAHVLQSAPEDLPVASAFRWAKVLDLGGDARLARGIVGTRIGSEYGDEAFWDSVVRWFVAHPELEPAHYGPIVDYLRHQKFGTPLADPAAGQTPPAPPQPNLCMKGRTPESLLRAVRDWHRGLADCRRVAVASWGPSGIPGFFRDEGGEPRRVEEVVELLTAEELREEGAAMQHCVAGYAHACASGQASIWSLRVRLGDDRAIRLATAEVRNRDRMVVQVRRRRNRLPTEREFALLTRWEEAGGPARSQWLVPR